MKSAILAALLVWACVTTAAAAEHDHSGHDAHAKQQCSTSAGGTTDAASAVQPATETAPSHATPATAGVGVLGVLFAGFIMMLLKPLRTDKGDVVLTAAPQPDTPAAATDAAVCAVGLAKWFDQRCVLQQINLEVAPGGFLSLLGANGAGKSTLLRMLATLISPSKGELFLFGQATGIDPAALRAKIGMISHQPILYRDLSVLENLTFFGRLYGVDNVSDRAMTLLDRVNLPQRAHDPVKTLSRGMTQRVAIARALMHEPELLLADEPFAGLDAPSTKTLEELLLNLHQQGKTIILSNHDIDQSLRLAQHAVVLRGGRVVIDRPTSGLDSDTVMEEVSRR